MFGKGLRGFEVRSQGRLETTPRIYVAVCGFNRVPYLEVTKVLKPEPKDQG